MGGAENDVEGLLSMKCQEDASRHPVLPIG